MNAGVEEQTALRVLASPLHTGANVSWTGPALAGGLSLRRVGDRARGDAGATGRRALGQRGFGAGVAESEVEEVLPPFVEPVAFFGVGSGGGVVAGLSQSIRRCV